MPANVASGYCGVNARLPKFGIWQRKSYDLIHAFSSNYLKANKNSKSVFVVLKHSSSFEI